MIKLHETLKRAFPTTFKQVTKHSSQAFGGMIIINDEELTFAFQAGAIQEVGHNGMQQTELLHFLAEYVKTLDKEVGCPHNLKTIELIEAAIDQQAFRTNDRISRGVEGTSKA